MAINKTKKLIVRGGSYVIVDAKDYDYLSQFKWHLDAKGYAKMSLWLKEDKRPVTIRMHQLIMGYKEGYVIDHIDRNPGNNSRSNLRFVTNAENFWNSDYADKILARRKEQLLAA